jgi:GDPmannose 4,6-dehydratase
MRTVREFVAEAFKLVGIDNWQDYIGVDPRYFRPQEVNLLQGDYSKAKKKLGWEPKVKFKELVKIMLESDIKAAGLDPKQYIKQ